MKNFIRYNMDIRGLCMHIMMTGLLLSPVISIAQSGSNQTTYAELHDQGPAISMTEHINRVEIVPMHLESNIQSRQVSPVRLVEVVPLHLESRHYLTPVARENASVEYVKVQKNQEEKDESRRPGFIYRNRYLLTGAVVAVGVGTYVLLKSDGSGGDPGFLPIPPGRP